jgi:mannose-6-phosphate isomerase class I
VSRLGPHAARQSAREGVLVSCSYFTTEKLRVDGTRQCAAVKGGQTIIMLEGEAEVGRDALRPGEAWYTSMPESFDLRGRSTLLRTYTS